MTIAVTGSTGQLGRLAIAALKPRLAGETLIALARDPGKAADLGVEARRADYLASDTLAAALAGVDRLILISSSDFNDRAGQHRNVIEAAREAGVGHLIYTSILKADASPMILAADHRVTEEAIRESGLPATLMRNGWYTENYTAALGGAVAAGAMAGGSGAGRLSTASRSDYAEALAVVATTEGHEGRTYELAGDSAYTQAEMAAEVSRLVGRQIPYHDLPEKEYAGLLQSFGLPEAIALAVADADAHAAEGWLFDDGGALGKLLGRPTTPMAATVAASLA